MSGRNNFKIFYAMSLAWQLGFIVAISIGCFMFFGYLIDDFFKTEPTFIILGFITSLVVTIYEGYHMIIPLIKDSKND